MSVLIRSGMMAAVLVHCFGCNPNLQSVAQQSESATQSPTVETKTDQETAKTEASNKLETITLGAGCFWCIEGVLLRVKGIESVTSGYMGGHVENPTYEQVCTKKTGHAEVVQVEFDPQVLPLDQLLDLFWQLHDPTTLNRQGYDEGPQYRSAIFYHSNEQKAAAEKSKQKWDSSGKFANPIVTEITQAAEFYKAEDYHQDFFAKNPGNPYCRANILPKLKKLGLLK